jgi:ribonuclease PH
MSDKERTYRIARINGAWVAIITSIVALEDASSSRAHIYGARVEIKVTWSRDWLTNATNVRQASIISASYTQSTHGYSNCILLHESK